MNSYMLTNSTYLEEMDNGNVHLSKLSQEVDNLNRLITRNEIKPVILKTLYSF